MKIEIRAKDRERQKTAKKKKTIKIRLYLTYWLIVLRNIWNYANKILGDEWNIVL